MTLYELNEQDLATIKALNCDSILKNRFQSFGIVKSSKLKVEKITMTKSTIQISIKNTKIALRKNEAICLEVEKCQ